MRGGIVAVLVTVGAAPLGAQAFVFATVTQAEVHALAVASARGGLLAGFGVNQPAGYYVRVGGLVAAGAATGPVAGTAARVGLTARFLADPFQEGRWGPYAGAGLVADWRPGAHGRAALELMAGTDLPGRAPWRPAVELGVGNGVRVSLAFRHTRRSGR
jgi:hypothetical protein